METRATVIIPTFGSAKFARWAIRSVQQQTVKDIEICIICDGSPESMISFFKNIEKEDPRIEVYVFPKSPKVGESYRDIVIKQTTGKIICYCGHDDLWLPNHVQIMEEALKECYFTHSIHVQINLPEYIKYANTLVEYVFLIDLNREIIKRMQGKANYFGLAFVAHTRKSYNELEEGWVTTPEDTWEDLYMWRKFLAAFGEHCKTTKKVTALKFAKYTRKHWTEQQRDEELRQYFEKIYDPVFITQLQKDVFSYPRNFQMALHTNQLIRWATLLTMRSISFLNQRFR